MTDTFDYAHARATALRLITKFGGDASLQRQTATAYNPNTSVATTAGVTETVKVCVLPIAPFIIAKSQGVLKQEDQKCYMAYSGNAGDPKQSDIITFNSVSYTVVNVSILGPSGVTVLYEMQVRR